MPLEIVTPDTIACDDNRHITINLDFYGESQTLFQTLHYQPHLREAGDEPSVAIRYNPSGEIVEVFVDHGITIIRNDEDELSPWMSLRDGRNATPDWNLAEQEGWGVFCNSDCETVIQRSDEVARFANDDEACNFVCQLAADGSAYHQMVLAYVAKENKKEPRITTSPVVIGKRATATVDVNLSMPADYDMDNLNEITLDIPTTQVRVYGETGQIPGAQVTGYTTQTVDSDEETPDDEA